MNEYLVMYSRSKNGPVIYQTTVTAEDAKSAILQFRRYQPTYRVRSVYQRVVLTS